MAKIEDVAVVERRMRELGEELGNLKADDVDVDEVEGRLLELAKGWGRAQMARAMKRADADAEMKSNGEHWGNRRETPHDYETGIWHGAAEAARVARRRGAAGWENRLGLGRGAPRLRDGRDCG